METFEVAPFGKNYQIEPQENGTFRVFEGEEKIGVVYPEIGDDGTEWKTMDELDENLVQ